MPTPFTHLAIARRMMTDEQVHPDLRAALAAEPGAFYLGQIAADGHYLAKRERFETHFYKYNWMPDDPPWRVMMREYPALWDERRAAARMFLCGYVAHLAVDEYWARHMATPHFGYGNWGKPDIRFLMLNFMLILMDERDYDMITHPDAARADMAGQLHAAQPDGWLPFLVDYALCDWGDLIHRQIKPGGMSETLDIIAPRLGVEWSPLKLRQHLADDAALDRDLWAHVPKSTLTEVEAGMYAYAAESMGAYWDELT